ncbi:La- protein 4B [Mortierella polycephala]|uniref:La- protein 4B n=1 Tax=Mortierella polycephala TaxID=41804 RepID=A0A9P6UA73_9FUNG|nr:La- protein 4B [Mortierella polycephala]
MDTFSHRPATGMTYSSSNESELRESANVNTHRANGLSNTGIRSKSNHSGPTYFPNYQMRPNQSGSSQYNENNGGLLTNSEIPLHQQSALAMPWAYASSSMVPAMTTPPPVHSPHVTNEHQANFEADLSRSSTSPMQSLAPQMGAGAHNSQDLGRDNLREQLEWYFSARNLATDTYLVSKMTADHWVPIAVIAEFNKIKQMTNIIQDIVDALRRSSKVTVDETGTMVKAIEVDRPRTTLILRDLSEDTKQEEIETFFKSANYPAKFITREVVGNMWFVEFATAEDAMAMLLYTRGRHIRDVPIAARLKSNTVLTGPDSNTSIMGLIDSIHASRKIASNARMRPRQDLGGTATLDSVLSQGAQWEMLLRHAMVINPGGTNTILRVHMTLIHENAATNFHARTHLEPCREFVQV